MGQPVQVPSIVLPTAYTLGTETELIDDTDEHTSVDILVNSLQEKMIYITAAEVVAAGVPGPLWCWIELSPWLTATSAAYWAAIGGGGGEIAPLSPHIEIGTGTNGRIHGIILLWTGHSHYARVVIQTPVRVETASWAVQCLIGGKSV